MSNKQNINVNLQLDGGPVRPLLSSPQPAGQAGRRRLEKQPKGEKLKSFEHRTDM